MRRTSLRPDAQRRWELWMGGGTEGGGGQTDGTCRVCGRKGVPAVRVGSRPAGALGGREDAVGARRAGAARLARLHGWGWGLF